MKQKILMLTLPLIQQLSLFLLENRIIIHHIINY